MPNVREPLLKSGSDHGTRPTSNDPRGRDNYFNHSNTTYLEGVTDMMARLSMLSLLTLALTIATLEHAAAAETFETVFATQPRRLACFARYYDRAHLQAHPRQKVASIEIDMTPTNLDGESYSPNHFELGVGLRPRGKVEWYGGNAICKSEGAIFTCYLEGDEGDLKLTPLPGGGLKAETTRIVLEGSDFFWISGTDFPEITSKSDDRVFILQRAPRAKCDAANAALPTPTRHR